MFGKHATDNGYYQHDQVPITPQHPVPGLLSQHTCFGCLVPPGGGYCVAQRPISCIPATPPVHPHWVTHTCANRLACQREAERLLQHRRGRLGPGGHIERRVKRGQALWMGHGHTQCGLAGPCC